MQPRNGVGIDFRTLSLNEVFLGREGAGKPHLGVVKVLNERRRPEPPLTSIQNLYK